MPLTDEQKRSMDARGTDWQRLHYAEPDEAIDAFDRGAVLVDTRRREAFEAWHFKGSINRRRTDVDVPLPHDKALYLFCT
jgi:rhodanese-related sulfurtransferase